MAELTALKGQKRKQKDFLKIPAGAFGYGIKDNQLTPEELLVWAHLYNNVQFIGYDNAKPTTKITIDMLAYECSFAKQKRLNNPKVVASLEGLIQKGYIQVEAIGNEDLVKATFLVVTLMVGEKEVTVNSDGEPKVMFQAITQNELKKFTVAGENNARRFMVYAYTKWRGAIKTMEWTTSYSYWANLLNYKTNNNTIEFIKSCSDFLGVKKGGKIKDSSGNFINEANHYYLLDSDEVFEVKKEAREEQKHAVTDKIKAINDFDKVTDERVDEATFKRLAVIGNSKEHKFEQSDYYIFKTTTDEALKELIENKIEKLSKNNNVAEMFERFAKDYEETEARKMEDFKKLSATYEEDEEYVSTFNYEVDKDQNDFSFLFED